MRRPLEGLLAGLLAWLLGLALLALALVAGAQDVQPVPALSARVIDQTGTLDAEQRAAIEARLAAFEAQAGPQIVVLMVASTQPEDIAAYAQRVGDAWKIGRRDVGDGLLLVVAKSDRQVRIEVAKALEGAVPDLAARQIIERQIRPHFRDDDYAGGIEAALDALMARIRGEALPVPGDEQAQGGGAEGVDLESMLALLFFGLMFGGSILTALLGRRLGALVSSGLAGGVVWRLGGGLGWALGAALAALLLVGVLGLGAGRRVSGRGGRGPWAGGGYAGGGGGWSSGSDGGFSSGGGGDFGGGGASGDW